MILYRHESHLLPSFNHYQSCRLSFPLFLFTRMLFIIPIFIDKENMKAGGRNEYLISRWVSSSIWWKALIIDQRFYRHIKGVNVPEERCLNVIRTSNGGSSKTSSPGVLYFLHSFIVIFKIKCRKDQWIGQTQVF